MTSIVAAILDIETDRVTDDNDDCEPEQRSPDDDGLPNDVEYRVETLHPLGIDLHELRLGQVRELLL